MFDVLVVGGGHAGVEAALAAARLGCRTLMVTHQAGAIARMPCNPSIGGIAKSHLVFELDALGGEMARNTDETGIQFRTLNASRGPAVQANRAQCDKHRYSARMQEKLKDVPSLTVLEDEVVGLWIQGADLLLGVLARHAGGIAAGTVILATGTSLSGKIHIGNDVVAGGGDDRPASDLLSESLRGSGFSIVRFKTGTPPRLDGRTIDWSRAELQPGDTPPPLFSWEYRTRQRRGEWSVDENVRRMFHVEHSSAAGGQFPCWMTHTTAETHRIIRENLSRSALYGGGITGKGARYCPSIEDKVVKFSDKESHHVFLEPEGVDTVTIYPNGISNSLPRDIQERLVHSIPALGHARILSYAYAIEYDCIDTLELTTSLESRRIPCLFFAGQINRTTGYEEAAAQGFVAGVNAAARALGRESITFSRQTSYLGVLIDDLVTVGTDEPYRMFTSRAERRLLLRQDNARFRLLDSAERLGLVPSDYISETRRIAAETEKELQRLRTTQVSGASLASLLSRPNTRYADLPDPRMSLPPEVREQVEIAVHYQGYIDQEERAVAQAHAQEVLRIPGWIDYWKLPSLRHEAREKFSRRKPETIWQASRIPGITPADVSVLTIALRSGKRPPATKREK